MSQTLSRWQAVVLGIVVLLASGGAVAGLGAVAAKQGFWADTAEITVGLPDAHDLAPGTPVRVRGVDAGQVVAVEYPEADGPNAAVTVRMRVQAKFAARLYADATAQVHATGLLGGKVIAVNPGTPAAGPLPDGRLTAATAPDLTQAAAKMAAVADEAAALLKDVRESNGTVGKLIRDDELYRDLKGLAADARGFVKQADKAVGTVEAEAGNVRALVGDGRDTLRSLKQGTDAVQKLPLVRGYVEDHVAILTRPECERRAITYNANDLFAPGSSVLTEGGKAHLTAAAEAVKGAETATEVVVAARHDPADPAQNAATADELTRKRAAATVEFLRSVGAHKMGWVTRRTLTPVGLGSGPVPVPDKEPVPPAAVQLLLFTPR